ncbi:MAG TPA: dephospho-CoA kinase, partial [Pseudomonadales bacterium]
MYIVGLTGGIGSGKTAVSDRFQQKGITIVDADLCSRVVVEKGRPALDAIRQHFGDSILTASGELDRAALRQRIFADPDEKAWLEQLLHPLIAEETFRQLESAQSPYVMLVSPLLIESGQDALCDRVLVVDVPESVQLSRTMQRDDNDEQQVRRIMQSQAD